MNLLENVLSQGLLLPGNETLKQNDDYKIKNYLPLYIHPFVLGYNKDNSLFEYINLETRNFENYHNFNYSLFDNYYDKFHIYESIISFKVNENSTSNLNELFPEKKTYLNLDILFSDKNCSFKFIYDVAESNLLTHCFDTKRKCVINDFLGCSFNEEEEVQTMVCLRIFLDQFYNFILKEYDHPNKIKNLINERQFYLKNHNGVFNEIACLFFDLPF